MAHPTGGYKNAAGKRVPGTTTIIGRFKDSGGLIWWAYGRGKEGVELYESRDKAAEAGTLAHAMCESYTRGIEWTDHEDVTGDESEEIILQAQNAYDNFLKWFKNTKMEIVCTEPELVSEAHQFGGSPDAIGLVDGEYCLIDYKTSNGLYPDYLIQVAAYQMLIEECLPEYPITGGFNICRFSKEFGDFHHHYFSDLPEAREQFLLFRQAYDNDKILKRRAK